MSVLQALLLGVLQGLTEFLPISSSGHLVIAQQLFGLEAGGDQLLGFDLALHFGTLLSVVAVFYRDLGSMIAGALRWLRRPQRLTVEKNEGAWLAYFVVIGTLPAVIIGYSGKDFFAPLFASAPKAGAMLVVTGCILWATRFVKQADRGLDELRLFDALWIGLAQAAAIIPGISRSGTTISAALFARWQSVQAARYSFLLAIPAILGGLVLEIKHVGTWTETSWLALLVGVASAAISGYFAIIWLIRILMRGRFSVFAYYCWAVGAATLVYFLW